MSDERFGQNLSTWLNEDAAHRVPSHVNELLVLSAASRQRPWWSSPERWLPMSTTTMGGRLAAPRPALWFALLAAIAVGAIGAALLAGAFRKPHATFGLAPNGRILITDGTSLKSFAADGTTPAVLATIPNGVGSLSLSPDATRVAVSPGGDGTDPLEIVNISDGSTVRITMPSGAVIGGEPISWSPDGRLVTFAGMAAGVEHVYVANTDGSTPPKALPAESLGTNNGVWQPMFSPDGIWISFIAAPSDSTSSNTGLIYLVHPDGTQLHRVAQGVGFGSGGNPSWAPDPAVQRLLYGTSSGVVVHDLEADKVYPVGGGFWPSWSPDGSKIAYWSDGPDVVDTGDVLAGTPHPIQVFAHFRDGCSNHPELSGRAVCSTVGWSPDGTKLIAPDITAKSVLVAPADGTGSPVSIPLQVASGDSAHVAWQPLR